MNLPWNKKLESTEKIATRIKTSHKPVLGRFALMIEEQGGGAHTQDTTGEYVLKTDDENETVVFEPRRIITGEDSWEVIVTDEMLTKSLVATIRSFRELG